MSQLAIECGVSKALIYHYYQSKEVLLYDIIFTHLKDLVDAVDAVKQIDDPDSICAIWCMRFWANTAMRTPNTSFNLKLQHPYQKPTKKRSQTCKGAW